MQSIDNLLQTSESVSIPLQGIRLRDFSVVPYGEPWYGRYFYCPYKNRILLPDAEGVYVMVNSDHVPMYVGSSYWLRKRLSLHPKMKEFRESPTWVYYLLTGNKTIYSGQTGAIEHHFIKILMPLHNILFNNKRFKRNRDGSYTEIATQKIVKGLGKGFSLEIINK